MANERGTGLVVRPAGVADAAAAASLLAQLGYPGDAASVAARIGRLSGGETDAVLVAELAGLVVGLLSCHLIPLFHMSGYRARVTALVVDSGCRGHGVGSTLLAAAEDWAQARDCAGMEITSGDQRHEAHRFYEGRGYVRQGKRLVKPVKSEVHN